MNLSYCIGQLSANTAAIQHLVLTVSDEQARWKPSTSDWSALEVINHLADEEREDFRTRFRHILSGASGDPPPIRPQEWVIERGYNQRDLQASLDDFLSERQRSLEWLRQLTDPPLDNRYQSPQGWSISAGDMLVSWVAHDVLHLRQLVELKWAYQLQQFAPYSPQYAGDW
jgi:hypothetical protein